MMYLPWILPSAAASLICIFLFAVTWKRRKLPATKALYFMLAAVFIWSFTQTLAMLNDSYLWKLNLSKVQYFGIVFAPYGWLVFSIIVFNKTELLSKKRLLFLSIIPFVTIILAFTNEQHHLIWKQVESVYIGIHSLNMTYGNWFIVHTIYSYSLVGIPTLYALIQYIRFPKKNARYKTMVVAPIVGVVTNGIYLLNVFGADTIDLTPLGFAFSMIIFTRALYKDNLMQLIPVARSILFEKMDDAVVVFEQNFRIVDINTSALTLFNVDKKNVIGAHFSSIVKEQNTLERVFENMSSELIINNLELQALKTELSIDGSNATGFLVVFRDISELKETQNNLLSARNKLTEAYKVMEETANTDVLTKLPNRRFFFEQFSIEIERANRHGLSMSLLILDLDHFKLINDTHGHPQGDKVLIRVATVLKSAVREIDFCGRIGGEEFAFILTETTLSGAKHFAERIRVLLENSHEEGDIAITASIGLSVREGNDTAESLFEKADNALYISKQSGRNNVSNK